VRPPSPRDRYGARLMTSARLSTKRVATVVALVALVALAGCGGDGDGDAKGASTNPAAGGAPLTKAQFIADADKICGATSVKIASAATKLRASANKTGTLPVRQVASFLTKTSLPAYDAMLDDLRALTPPKGDEKAIDGFIAALAGAIDTTKADPVKYSKNGSADPFDDANKRAIDYGMKVCGS
jgi:hypothetical protein